MQMNVKDTRALTAGRREWIALAVIALPCLLYSMDLSVLYLALPSLTADLKPSGAQLLWISDIYGFMLAGFLITMGTLGDRIGRRRLLLIGAAAFGAASVLAAFASSVPMLIAARALLGIAASTLAPSTLSLIRNMFLDPRQRTLAIGIWVTSFSLGAALGPALGGLLLHFFWWGSVFLIAVPVMVLLLVVGPILLPEFRDPDAGRFDLVSAALSLVSVLAIVYGVKEVAEHGFGPVPALSFFAGSTVGVAFVRGRATHELRRGTFTNVRRHVIFAVGHAGGDPGRRVEALEAHRWFRDVPAARAVRRFRCERVRDRGRGRVAFDGDRAPGPESGTIGGGTRERRRDRVCRYRSGSAPHGRGDSALRIRHIPRNDDVARVPAGVPDRAGDVRLDHRPGRVARDATAGQCDGGTARAFADRFGEGQ
jgi:hypothetical protein